MIWWVIGVTSAILFILWFYWELKHAPVEDFDRDLGRKEDHAAADQCIQASRPAPLDHPHPRAITEPRK